MHFTLEQIADATDGSIVEGPPGLVVDGAGIDSRSIGAGALFVALVAARDGHDYVVAAVDNGAAAALVERPVAGVPCVVVADTMTALQALGRAARARIGKAVVGITGSVGKTSTKDLLAAAVGDTFATHASHRSFNNELGVPLTLLGAPDATEVAIVEMGARGVGHIAELCAIATPDIGVITMVGSAHTELFGTVDDVAVAKGELVEALPPTGTAVLNADDHRVAAMASRTAASVVTFGLAHADVRAADIAIDPDLHASFSLVVGDDAAPVRLGVAGAHMVPNALAAAAVATAIGVPLEQIAAGLGRPAMSPWRMEVDTAPSGATVINDAYNANPMSMHAAIDALLALDLDRRIAVIGVMAELGAEAEAEHRAIGDRLAAAGVEVISVDVAAYGGHLVPDAAAAQAVLDHGPALDARTGVLVKGSRVAALETVAAALLA